MCSIVIHPRRLVGGSSGQPARTAPMSPGPDQRAMPPTYAELHCHTNFSFLDGASTVDDLVERAVELQMPALAVTDHDGLYGVVRFALAAEAAGIRPVLGIEIELLDAAAPDPHRVVVPARRPGRGPARGP